MGERTTATPRKGPQTVNPPKTNTGPGARSVSGGYQLADEYYAKLQKLEQRARQARKVAEKKRAELAQATRRAAKLSTIARSNARLLKELAQDHNSEMHTLHGNTVEALEAVARFFRGNLEAEHIMTIPTALKLLDYFEDFQVHIVRLEVLNQEGWEECNIEWFRATFEDLETSILNFEYARVKARLHNARMHALVGNIKGGSTPKESSIKTDKAAEAKAKAQARAAAEVHRAAVVKPAKKYKITAINVMADKVSEELEKMAGEEDARREKLEAEKRALEEEQAANARLRKMEQDLVDLAPYLKHRFLAIYTGPNARETEYFPENIREQLGLPHIKNLIVTPRVGYTLADLQQPVVPHEVLSFEAELVQFKEPGRRLPSMKKYEVEVGLVSTLLVTWSIRGYGFCWKELNDKMREYGRPDIDGTSRLSLETLMAMHFRHLASSGDFNTVLDAVSGYLSTNMKADHNQYDPSASGHMADFLYTCFLLLMGGHQTLDAQSIGEKVISDTIYRSIVRDRCPAPGTYVRGYELEVRDIFPAPTQIRDVVSRASGYMRETAESVKKQWSECRLSSVHVADFLPSFPLHESVINQKLGFIKRLACARGQPTDAFKTNIRSAVRWLKHTYHPEETLSMADVRAECLKHTQENGFTEEQKAKYMMGVDWALSLKTLGDLELGASMLGEAGGFNKMEVLDEGKKKTPRYIVAPNFYMRGYSHAILMSAQRNFFHQFKSHTVKGLTREEQKVKVHSAMEGRSGFLETDYTSFESNITSFYIEEVEKELFVHFADEAMKPLVADMFSKLAHQTTEVKSSTFTMFLEPMRLSGTDHTSAGNCLVNFCITMAIMYEAMGRTDPMENFLDWMENTHPYFFEGDDGLMHVGSDIDMARLKSATQHSGAKLTFEYDDDMENLNFCGMTTEKVYINGHPRIVNMVNPMTILSKMFALFSPADTCRHDDEISAAKALSYYDLYHDLPIIGPVSRAVCEFYQRQRVFERIRSHFIDLDGHTLPLDYWGSKILGGLPLPSRADFMRSLDRFKEQVAIFVEASAELRQSVADRFHISISDQHTIEHQLVEQLERGHRVLRCDTLVRLWRENPGVQAMRQRVEDDAREIAKTRAKLAAAKDFMAQAVPSYLAEAVSDYRTAAMTLWRMVTTLGLSSTLAIIYACWLFPSTATVAVVSAMIFHVVAFAALTILYWAFSDAKKATARATATLAVLDAALLVIVVETVRLNLRRGLSWPGRVRRHMRKRISLWPQAVKDWLMRTEDEDVREETTAARLDELARDQLDLMGDDQVPVIPPPTVTYQISAAAPPTTDRGHPG